MRTTDRILTLILSLALFAFGCLVVAEVVQSALGNPEPLLLPYPAVAEFFGANTWTSGWVVAGAVVVGLLGLLLFLSEVRRRRPALLAMRTTDPGVVAAISRKSITRALDSAVRGAPGIERSTVRPGRRKIRIRAAARSGAPADVREQVTRRAEDALNGLALQGEPTLSVSVSGGSTS